MILNNSSSFSVGLLTTTTSPLFSLKVYEVDSNPTKAAIELMISEGYLESQEGGGGGNPPEPLGKNCLLQARELQIS